MDAKYVTAHDNILKAREALRRGDKASARALGEQAALLVPELEDAWLILAASDPDPQEALAYARKALELKPESARAKKAVEWATGLAKQASVEKARMATEGSSRTAPAAVVVEAFRSDPSPVEEKIQHNAVTAFPRFMPKVAEEKPKTETKPKSRLWIYAAAAGLLVCVVLAVAAWSALSSPVLASFLGNAPAPTQENLWASVEVPKPSVTSIDVSVFGASDAASTATPIPTEIRSTVEPTETPAPVADIPTSLPTEAFTATPEVTETPGVMALEIVADTPTAAYAAPNPEAPKPSAASNGARWIDVDLTHQMVYAYEGETVVNSFLVSTGTWLHPTVTGQYKIYVKYSKANMSGPGYFLPDVPYVMYFYQSYGLHGTYWHHNFGTPMSHGCVNLETGNAQWLYNWASVGTVVNVHY